MAIEEYHRRFYQLWRAVDRYLAAEAFGTYITHLAGQDEAIRHQTHTLQMALGSDNVLETLEQVEHVVEVQIGPRKGS